MAEQATESAVDRDALVSLVAKFLHDFEDNGELYTPAAERLIDLIRNYDFTRHKARTP